MAREHHGPACGSVAVESVSGCHRDTGSTTPSNGRPAARRPVSARRPATTSSCACRGCSCRPAWSTPSVSPAPPAASSLRRLTSSRSMPRSSPRWPSSPWRSADRTGGADRARRREAGGTATGSAQVSWPCIQTWPRSGRCGPDAHAQSGGGLARAVGPGQTRRSSPTGTSQVRSTRRRGGSRSRLQSPGSCAGAGQARDRSVRARAPSAEASPAHAGRLRGRRRSRRRGRTGPRCSAR